MNKFISQIGIGGLIGLIGGLGGVIIGGIAVFMASPMGGVTYIVISILFFGLFWKVMFKPMWQNARILEVGVPAQAKILVIAENGSSLRINGSLPKAGVDLTLEIHLQNKSPYTIIASTYVSIFELQRFQVGQMVAIKIDPDHPDRIAFTETTPAMENYASAPSSMIQTGLQVELKQLVEQQGRLFQTGEEAKATIISMKELPVHINGDNPLLALTLEVRPLNKAPYEATLKVAVKRTSLPNFQPRMDVTVKFDPKNPSDVAVFHSGSTETPTTIT